MRILIGADFVPTVRNISQFETGAMPELLGGDLDELLKSSDYRIFNLELPLVDHPHPIIKCGPNLIAPTACVAGYKAVGVNLLTLANNHIMDQGQLGLSSTVQVLEQAGISYTGVGKTLAEAAKPFVFECNGKRIGVYACVEHEFSVVTDHSSGANPIDLLESPDHVAELKTKCDYAIVLYHGGKEHYRYPSPNLQKVCRKLVEKGADLVVCQHSHCIGCEEKYLKGTIVYGQGNFLFDDDESEFWQTGMLISIDDNFNISYIPLLKNGNGVSLATGKAEESILRDFYARSMQIKDSVFLEKEYDNYARSMFDNYLSLLTGKKSKIGFRIMNKLTKGYWNANMKKRIPLSQRLAILNFIECEAHRELLIFGLKKSCNLK